MKKTQFKHQVVFIFFLILGIISSTANIAYVSAAPEAHRYVKVLISSITINPGAVTHEETRADVYWTVWRWTWEHPSWVEIGSSFPQLLLIDFEGTLEPNWETPLWQVPQDVQWVQFRIEVWDYDVARADGDDEPDLLDVASSAGESAYYDVNIWFNIYEGIYGRADPYRGDVDIGESGGRDGSIMFDVLTQPTLVSTNEAGVIKDYFLPGQTVCVKGSGYSEGTYDVYVVVDEPTWSFGMSLVRVPGTERQVSTDASGNLQVQPVWIQANVIGKYDIVVDIDQSTTFTAGDVLDSSDVLVTAGFNVVPELPFGTIMSFLSMFTALAGFIGLKRFRCARAS